MTFQEQEALLDLAAFITWCVQHEKAYFYCIGNVGHDIAGMVRQDPDFMPRTTGFTKRI